MAGVNKLLIDADALVALRDENDSNHSKAVEISASISKLKPQLLISDPAFGEAVTVISQKKGINVAIKFAEEVLAGPAEFIEVDSHLRWSALEIFKKQTSKNSRFTDCVNMAILKNKGADTIFSFDKQYKVNKFKRFGIDQ